MTTNVEIITQAYASIKPELAEITKLESALEARKAALADVIGAASLKIEPTEDYDEVDELRDAIYDVAWSLGMTWNGDWTPGERIEFWVPSTC